MIGSRHRLRSDEGALARARRFLGRVIGSVRGSERPSDVPPPPSALEHVEVASHAMSPEQEAAATQERAIVEPSAEALPSPGDPARALLADPAWSGIRSEDLSDRTLVAWRDATEQASTLRTVEVHCDFGALDAAPRVVVRDQPITGATGATTLESRAARIVVALGAMREGSFVSLAHATVR
ncbi:MAG: hypothetical protein OHK0013_19070 [Sandaracinaceae bacterium]